MNKLISSSVVTLGALVALNGCGNGGPNCDNNNTEPEPVNPVEDPETIKLNQLEKDIKEFLKKNSIEKEEGNNYNMNLTDNIKNIKDYYIKNNFSIDFVDLNIVFSKLDKAYKNKFISSFYSEGTDVKYLVEGMLKFCKFTEIGIELSESFRDDNGNFVFLGAGEILIDSILSIQTIFTEEDLEIKSFNENFAFLTEEEKFLFYKALEVNNFEYLKRETNKIYNLSLKDKLHIIGDDYIISQNDLPDDTEINIIETDDSYIFEYGDLKYEIEIINFDHISGEEKIKISDILKVFIEVEKIKRIYPDIRIDDDYFKLGKVRCNFKLFEESKINGSLKYDLRGIVSFLQTMNKTEIEKYIDEDIVLDEAYYSYINFEFNNKRLTVNGNSVYFYEGEPYSYTNKYIFSDYKLVGERYKDEDIKVYDDKGDIAINKILPNREISEKMLRGEYSWDELENLYNKYFNINIGSNTSILEGLKIISTYNKLQKYVSDGTNKENPFEKAKNGNEGETFENPLSRLVNFNNDCDGWATDFFKPIQRIFESISGVKSVNPVLTFLSRHETMIFEIEKEDGKIIYGTYGTFGVNIVVEDINKKLTEFEIRNLINKENKNLELGIDKDRLQEALKKLWEKFSWTNNRDIKPILYQSNLGADYQVFDDSKDISISNILSDEEINKVKLNVFISLYSTLLSTKINKTTYIRDNTTKLAKLSVNQYLYKINIKGLMYDFFRLFYVNIRDSEGNKLTEKDINIFLNELGNIDINTDYLEELFVDKLHIDFTDGLTLPELYKIFYGSNLSKGEAQAVLDAIKKTGFEKIKDFILEKGSNVITQDYFMMMINELEKDELNDFILSIQNFDFLEWYPGYYMEGISKEAKIHIINNTTKGNLLIEMIRSLPNDFDFDFLGMDKLEEFILSGKKFWVCDFFEIYFYKDFIKFDKPFDEYINNKNLDNFMGDFWFLKYQITDSSISIEESKKIIDKLYLLLSNNGNNILEYSSLSIKAFIEKYENFYPESDNTKILLSNATNNLEDLDSLIHLLKADNLSENEESTKATILTIKNQTGKKAEILVSNPEKYHKTEGGGYYEVDIDLNSTIYEIVDSKDIEQFFKDYCDIETNNLSDIGFLGNDRYEIERGSERYKLVKYILQKDGVLDEIQSKDLFLYYDIVEYYDLNADKKK